MYGPAIPQALLHGQLLSGQSDHKGPICDHVYRKNFAIFFVPHMVQNGQRILGSRGRESEVCARCASTHLYEGKLITNATEWAFWVPTFTPRSRAGQTEPLAIY
jgi:hypothetical protein